MCEVGMAGGERIEGDKAICFGGSTYSELQGTLAEIRLLLGAHRNIQ